MRKFRNQVAKATVALLVFIGAAFGTAAPASAEVDRFSDICISVDGHTRSCAYAQSINWGSGMSWKAMGKIEDRASDRWYSTIEVKLNRKWASNTGWIQVARAYDRTPSYSGSSINSTSGYDPTYGAWVRVCVSNGSTSYCSGSRYVTDNS